MGGILKRNLPLEILAIKTEKKIQFTRKDHSTSWGRIVAQSRLEVWKRQEGRGGRDRSRCDAKRLQKQASEQADSCGKVKAH